MANKKVSVIIPASNEEKFIKETVASFKNQNYSQLEVIVVVNNSHDKTYDIAKSCADKVLNIENCVTVGEARNKGAESADGEVFIFSDADTYLTQGGVKKIAEITDESTIGIPLGKGMDGGKRGKLFFFYKNLGHRLGLYRAAIFGILFCHRNVFLKTKGFNKEKRIAEFADFIKRAKKSGAKYKLITDFHAVTSLRRFERNGYLKEYIFWAKWRMLSFFGRGERLEKKYFNNKNV